MKIKDGFLLREFDDRYIVVSVDDTANNFNGIITLNSSAVFVWNLLQSSIEYTDLLSKITDAYNVSYEIAKKDLDMFLNTVRQAELLDE